MTGANNGVAIRLQEHRDMASAYQHMLNIH